VQYENELAALMAMELGHVLNRSLSRRLTSSNLARENFVFSVQDYLKAVRASVFLLYHSGYDPRGVVTYLNLMGIVKVGELNPSDILVLKREANKSISKFAPLKNPIIRSDEFVKMRGSLRAL